jgi:protein SCO1/2
LKGGKFIYLAFALVAVLSAVTGAMVYTASQREQALEQPALLVLPEARHIPDFSLVDHDGAAFGPKRLRGRWSLLFFGFTHCPDICPGTLFDLQQLDQRLAANGVPPSAYQVVFVSVDPERDDPARLKDYVNYFDPDFIGVTGNHAVMEPLTRTLGIAYRIDDHEAGAGDYGVDHSASVLLVNPEGSLHGVFPAPLEVAAMDDALRGLVN